MRFTPGQLTPTEQGAARLELDEKRCTICYHYAGTVFGLVACYKGKT